MQLRAWMRFAALVAVAAATSCGGSAETDGDEGPAAPAGAGPSEAEPLSAAVRGAAAAPLSLHLDVVKLVPGDADPGDSFGAAVGLWGATAIVGAWLDAAAPEGASGSAYVFRGSSMGWDQDGRLFGSDRAAGDCFGRAVAAFDEVVVVGAPCKATARGRGAGVAYVFRRDQAGWVEDARLTASDGDARAAFGGAVAIARGAIVIGAPGDDSDRKGSGAAYVFRRRGAVWIEEAKLVPGEAERGERFGAAVAISTDTVVVGPGAAHVFERVSGQWTERARLDPPPGASLGRFASSLAISGEVLAAGAPRADRGRSMDAGAVHVFERIDGLWKHRALLSASDGASGDQLGWSVAVSSERIVAGAPFHTHAGAPPGAGAVYTFQRRGEGWVTEGELVARDGAPSAHLGSSVAAWGQSLIGGAPRALLGHGLSAGAAYVFEP